MRSWYVCDRHKFFGQHSYNKKVTVFSILSFIGLTLLICHTSCASVFSEIFSWKMKKEVWVKWWTFCLKIFVYFASYVWLTFVYIVIRQTRECFLYRTKFLFLLPFLYGGKVVCFSNLPILPPPEKFLKSQFCISVLFSLPTYSFFVVTAIVHFLNKPCFRTLNYALHTLQSFLHFIMHSHTLLCLCTLSYALNFAT